jgi:hypothetical protein
MGLLVTRGRQRPQFKWRPTQFEQGASVTLPAPYGGINLRSDITAMAPNEARSLENWLPGAGQCDLRPGFTDWGTGVGSAEVKTLVPFVGYTASRLLAAGGGKIFNVTSAGAGVELATGFTDDRWQTALYSDRLFFVNGTDNPQVYNGSTVSAIVWAGVGLSADNDLINIALVRNRLWFCEKEKARVWYGAIGQITAASNLTIFDLTQIASGGICMAIGSWSRDAGDGADDMTVFVMSTGEILIYQGDPGSTFSLIGKYWTGAPPIGRQCLFKIGGELMVITSLGLLPVSAAIGGVALDLSRIDPWGKIAAGIVADAVLDSGNAGWHGCLHNGVVYINVPQTTGSLSKQWVINTRNGACATYSGWHPSSIASFGGSLYFGAMAGGLVRLVGGEDDDGEPITANANCAFTFPTQGQRNNLFTAIRPVMDAEGTVTGLIGVDTNFIIRTLSGASVTLIEDPSTTPWGSEWGSPWGSQGGARPQWFSIRGEGRSVSVRMRAVNTALNCRWYSTDLLFKPGGIR